MSLTSQEIATARSKLAESKAHLWNGEDGVNESASSFIRYWRGIGEREIDSYLEFLTRFGSASNLPIVALTGAELPDADGTYTATGSEVNGSNVFLRTDGKYRFEVGGVPGAYYWQLIQVYETLVVWTSSTFISTASLSSVTWSAADAVLEIEDGMEIEDGWQFTDGGILVPEPDYADVTYSVPSQFTVYRSVTNPMVNGKVRDGIWRIGPCTITRDYDDRYNSAGTWVIVQTLALELNDTAPYAISDTRWRQRAGENARSGSRNVVLELPWVDPSVVQSLADALNAGGNVFNSSIYSVNGGLLSGKWYHVDADWQVDEKTGFGKITWFLRNHDNEDFRFVYQANQSETHVDFFKQNMPTTGIEDFEDNYYFAPNGDFYVSTDGVNYTAKNGTAATGVLPADADLITTTVAGRLVVRFAPAPDEDTGEIDLRIRFVYKTAVVNGGVAPGDFIIEYGEAEETTRFVREYIGAELPDKESSVGVVASGGRSKTVTRIQNPRIVDGLFHYDLYEVEFTAPQAPADAWFYHGGSASSERERKGVYSAPTDAAGNAGWMPVDGQPYIHTVEIATMRPKHVTVERKYFVRWPLPADLTTAGIDEVHDPVEFPATDPTISYVDAVRQLGKHLFCVERTKIELGTIVKDRDAKTQVDLTTWEEAGPISVET